MKYEITVDVDAIYGIAVFDENMIFSRTQGQVSCAVGLSRNRCGIKTLPSLPLRQRKSGTETSYTGFTAKWPRNSEPLTLDTKLDNLNQKTFEISVMLSRGSEQILVGISSLKFISMVLETEINIPIHLIGSSRSVQILHASKTRGKKKLLGKEEFKDSFFQSNPSEVNNGVRTVSFKGGDSKRKYALNEGAYIKLKCSCLPRQKVNLSQFKSLLIENRQNIKVSVQREQLSDALPLRRQNNLDIPRRKMEQLAPVDLNRIMPQKNPVDHEHSQRDSKAIDSPPPIEVSEEHASFSEKYGSYVYDQLSPITVPDAPPKEYKSWNDLFHSINEKISCVHSNCSINENTSCVHSNFRCVKSLKQIHPNRSIQEEPEPIPSMINMSNSFAISELASISNGVGKIKSTSADFATEENKQNPLKQMGSLLNSASAAYLANMMKFGTNSDSKITRDVKPHEKSEDNHSEQNLQVSEKPTSGLAKMESLIGIDFKMSFMYSEKSVDDSSQQCQETKDMDTFRSRTARSPISTTGKEHSLISVNKSCEKIEGILSEQNHNIRNQGSAKVGSPMGAVGKATAGRSPNHNKHKDDLSEQNHGIIHNDTYRGTKGENKSKEHSLSIKSQSRDKRENLSEQNQDIMNHVASRGMAGGSPIGAVIKARKANPRRDNDLFSQKNKNDPSEQKHDTLSHGASNGTTGERIGTAAESKIARTYSGTQSCEKSEDNISEQIFSVRKDLSFNTAALGSMLGVDISQFKRAAESHIPFEDESTFPDENSLHRYDVAGKSKYGIISHEKSIGSLSTTGSKSNKQVEISMPMNISSFDRYEFASSKQHESNSQINTLSQEIKNKNGEGGQYELDFSSKSDSSYTTDYTDSIDDSSVGTSAIISRITRTRAHGGCAAFF